MRIASCGRYSLREPAAPTSAVRSEWSARPAGIGVAASGTCNLALVGYCAVTAWVRPSPFGYRPRPPRRCLGDVPQNDDLEVSDE